MQTRKKCSCLTGLCFCQADKFIHSLTFRWFHENCQTYRSASSINSAILTQFNVCYMCFFFHTMYSVNTQSRPLASLLRNVCKYGSVQLTGADPEFHIRGVNCRYVFSSPSASFPSYPFLAFLPSIAAFLSLFQPSPGDSSCNPAGRYGGALQTLQYEVFVCF